MTNHLKTLSAKDKKEYLEFGPDCPIHDVTIQNLSHYLAVFSSVVKPDGIFWFRGHADLKWTLTPSALRYRKQKREKALELLATFKRYVEMKLDRPPTQDEELKWLQIAQHYGLPTRLLDWTENAAIALYFACIEPNTNGLVFILNPVDLNRIAEPQKPRVFDNNNDAVLIRTYLGGAEAIDANYNSKIISIHPTWNSERIMRQQGVFTLHGTEIRTLRGKNVSSLVFIPILKKYKQNLLSELQRFGVSEMTIFPEIEHICNFLKQNAKLI